MATRDLVDARPERRVAFGVAAEHPVAGGGVGRVSPPRARCAPPASPRPALPPTCRTCRRPRSASKRIRGASALGMAEKSGQMRLLKMWVLSAAMVPSSACTCSGGAPSARRRAATASSISGRLATWSRWEWVSSTCWMRAISSRLQDRPRRCRRRSAHRRPAGTRWCGSLVRWRRSTPVRVPSLAFQVVVGLAGRFYLVSKLVAPSHPAGGGECLMETTRSA